MFAVSGALLVADACGLALFSVLGARAALALLGVGGDAPVRRDIIAGLGLRRGAIPWNLSLPVFSLREEHDSQH